MIRTKGIVAIVLSLALLAGVSYAACASGASDPDTTGVGDRFSRFRVSFPAILGRTGSPTLELAASLPEVDDVTMIYKVIEPDITADAVTEIGRRLGFEGEVITGPGELTYVMSDETGSLSVWPDSGAIAYTRRDVAFPKEPPTLPSNEEAKRIAIDFLNEAGLSLPDAAVQEPIPGAQIRGAEDKSYVCHLLVEFACEIDGVPLTGPGAKFNVRIGSNGEVGRMLRVWREVEAYQQVTIKSPEQAFEELRQGKGTHNALVDCEKVVLDSVYLAYWMEGPDDKQEYVVPVYVFEGEYLDEEGEPEDFRGYCNAL